jgi:hypothetical protein
MSDNRTAKPVQFRVLNEAPPKRPAWLEDGQSAPIRKLFQPVEDEASRPGALSPNDRPSTRPSEMPPSAANASVPPPAAAPTPSRAAEAAQRAVEAAAARPEHAEPADPDHQLEVYSKLPPPPRLGSLIPGARSAPPPAAANDVSLELLHEQREAFTNAALELAVARAAALSELEGQLLDLSIEIAASLVEGAIQQDPALHSVLARAALASLGNSERVTLRTSPDAFEAICQTVGGPETTLNGVRVLVHADDTIPGLGCIVDGENVRIDATVAERLRAVRRAFEDERRKVAENNE